LLQYKPFHIPTLKFSPSFLSAFEVLTRLLPKLLLSTWHGQQVDANLRSLEESRYSGNYYNPILIQKGIDNANCLTLCSILAIFEAGNLFEVAVI
jgi:hypothetical protein